MEWKTFERNSSKHKTNYIIIAKTDGSSGRIAISTSIAKLIRDYKHCELCFSSDNRVGIKLLKSSSDNSFNICHTRSFDGGALTQATISCAAFVDYIKITGSNRYKAEYDIKNNMIIANLDKGQLVDSKPRTKRNSCDNCGTHCIMYSPGGFGCADWTSKEEFTEI